MSKIYEKDVAATLVGEHHHELQDKKIEARVVRKIDLYLIPLMIVGYSLVYYDKAILGSAAVLGMSTELHLRQVNPVTKKVDTSRLSWATSLFYFGMLAGLYPLTYLFQRFTIGKVVGSVVIIW